MAFLIASKWSSNNHNLWYFTMTCLEWHHIQNYYHIKYHHSCYRLYWMFCDIHPSVDSSLSGYKFKASIFLTWEIKANAGYKVIRFLGICELCLSDDRPLFSSSSEYEFRVIIRFRVTWFSYAWCKISFALLHNFLKILLSNNTQI